MTQKRAQHSNDPEEGHSTHMTKKKGQQNNTETATKRSREKETHDSTLKKTLSQRQPTKRQQELSHGNRGNKRKRQKKPKTKHFTLKLAQNPVTHKIESKNEQISHSNKTDRTPTRP